MRNGVWISVLVIHAPSSKICSAKNFLISIEQIDGFCFSRPEVKFVALLQHIRATKEHVLKNHFTRNSGTAETQVPKRSTEASEDRRAELARRMPPKLQPFLTFVTGKAGPEKPLWTNSSGTSAGITLATLFGGGAVTAALLSAPAAGPGLLIIKVITMIPSLLATAGAVRAINSTLLHHSTHRTFTDSKFYQRIAQTRLFSFLPKGIRGWNRFVGEIVSTIALVAPYDLYHRDHSKHHAGENLATWKDPDWRFLFIAGFVPGKKVSNYWFDLVKAILSPGYHLEVFKNRLRDNLFNPDTPPYRRAMGWAWLAVLALVVSVSYFVFGAAALNTFAIAWAFPVAVLSQVNNLLQVLSEHWWLRVSDSPDRRVQLARKTRGRFLGAMLPSEELSWIDGVVAWTFWWLRLLLVELLIGRLFVLPADLNSHDWHHRHPGNPNWPNSTYARQADIDAGTPGWEEPYQEVWGIENALQDVFRMLASLPPLDGPPEPLTGEEQAEFFRTM